MKPDFGGYATKCGVRCSDGVVIDSNAFIQDNGKRVPVVWNHQHGSIGSVLGHAILEHRNDGVFANVYLNNTQAGMDAKECVSHGDIKCLSIWADRLKRSGPNIVHGCIREVSLVLAGANPKATIDEDADVVIHGDLYEEDAALMYCGDTPEMFDIGDHISHAEDGGKGGKTNQEIFDSMTQEQKDLVYEMIGMAVDSASNADDDEEDDEVEHSGIHDEYEEDHMKYSPFDKDTRESNTGVVGGNVDTISHDELQTIVDEAKRHNMKLSEAFIAHGIGDITYPGDYISHGITNLGYMFPEARTIGNGMPEWIKRDTGWVSYVMSKVHHTPFANVKSLFADITGEDARALGYIKGKLKKEEVFTMLKRTTTPQTVYKKQKIDRDDIIDLANPGLLAWLKAEMRMMLDEELARAFLIGDGRLASSDDKIKEANIRPIANEEELYKIDVDIASTLTGDALYKEFIRQVILSRIEYKGSGSPDLFCSESMLANMMLMTDTTGRDLYNDEAALARKLRVNKIVTVPLLENNDIYGIVVNLNDYNVGADQGGSVTLFDKFDIDYNQQKYLIETRCSGALIRPYSAVVLKKKTVSTGGSGGSGGGETP